MNSKFSVPNSVPVTSCSIENFSFIVHSARAFFVNKTLTTVSKYQHEKQEIVFLLNFDIMYISMPKEMFYISFITWQKIIKLLQLMSNGKFSVFTLGNVNTALNQSAFRTHKSYIINFNITFSRLLILILLQSNLSA